MHKVRCVARLRGSALNSPNRCLMFPFEASVAFPEGSGFGRHCVTVSAYTACVLRMSQPARQRITKCGKDLRGRHGGLGL